MTMISMRYDFASLRSQRALERTNGRLAGTYGRLSTGRRIQVARDGAAELAISGRARSRLRSTGAARMNVSAAAAATATADGGLNEISGLLIRMRELAVASATDVLGEAERGFLDREFQQLTREIERIAETTTYGDIPLLVNNRVDVGFVLDGSSSVDRMLDALRTAVVDFEEDFTSRGLDVEFALASVNATFDPIDATVKLADFGDGNFTSALASITLANGQLDPYSALLSVSGIDDVPGTNDPDEFNWRGGAKRLLVYITDSGRETELVSTTEQEVADALANATITTHIITEIPQDDRDSIPGSDLDGIAAGTGGVYADRGNVFGTNLAATLDQIAATVDGQTGRPEYELQLDIDPGEESRLTTALPLDARASALGVADLSVGTVTGALEAMDALDEALDALGAMRTEVGVLSNRLQTVDANLAMREETTSATLSRLVDADLAGDAAALAKDQLLLDAGRSMLAQVQQVRRDVVLGLVA